MCQLRNSRVGKTANRGLWARTQVAVIEKVTPPQKKKQINRGVISQNKIYCM